MAMTSPESRECCAPDTAPESVEATESVCPVCLCRLPAQRVRRGNDVYLQKTCPEHGPFETVIWRATPGYLAEEPPRVAAFPENPVTPVEKGCPYDCGLCGEHRQQPCCVLLEVTQRCDLGCPVCFASASCAPGLPADPGLDVVAGWFRKLKEAGGPYNIQLSGGEPCLRDDLPEIITLGRSYGFSFFQVNTNGLRLARDGEYLLRLKNAGLSVVYLQFDGTNDDVYRTLRGRALLEQKMAAIEQCIRLNIGVVLVPTIVPGVNDRDIGNLLRFALRYHPGVRGLHFQPVSYFGRYPQGTAQPGDDRRITLPEIIRALEEQSGGLVKRTSFKSSGGPHARCSFNGNFNVLPDGSLLPMTKQTAQACCGQPLNAQAERRRAQAFVARAWVAPQPVAATPTDEWDAFIVRSRNQMLAISGMAFQDAWTLELERLKECYIMVVAPNGNLVPFCAYNLTGQDGKSLYRAG